MTTTLVTNTTEGAIRIFSVVVPAGRSGRVDSEFLASLRHKDASPAERAHGEGLVDGTPILGADAIKVVEDAKAEAKAIVAAAKAEAKAAKTKDDDTKKTPPAAPSAPGT